MAPPGRGPDEMLQNVRQLIELQPHQTPRYGCPNCRSYGDRVAEENCLPVSDVS